MKVTFNPAGLLFALFAGFLASALFHLSFAWCVVIGIGTIPALIATLSVFIWLLDRPFVNRVEWYFMRRKRDKNMKQIAANKERMRARRDRS